MKKIYDESGHLIDVAAPAGERHHLTAEERHSMGEALRRGGTVRQTLPAPAGGEPSLEDALKHVRSELFALCEDTEERYGAEAQRDTETKMGAFARGRVKEAKGIRDAMGEVFRDVLSRLASRAGGEGAGEAQLRHECAGSGYHDHDGCSCTDAELNARAAPPQPAPVERARRLVDNTLAYCPPGTSDTQLVRIAYGDLKTVGEALTAPPQPAPALPEREAFEKWQRSRYVTDLRRNPLGTWGDEHGENYFARFVQAAWEGWQARAALAAGEGAPEGWPERLTDYGEE